MNNFSIFRYDYRHNQLHHLDKSLFTQEPGIVPNKPSQRKVLRGYTKVKLNVNYIYTHAAVHKTLLNRDMLI